MSDQPSVTPSEIASRVLELDAKKPKGRMHEKLVLSVYRQAAPVLAKEVQRMSEGEKWAGSMFAEITAAAVSGLADAVIVVHAKYTAQHTLKAVTMLRDRTRELEQENATLRELAEGLRTLSIEMRRLLLAAVETCKGPIFNQEVRSALDRLYELHARYRVVS